MLQHAQQDGRRHPERHNLPVRRPDVVAGPPASVSASSDAPSRSPADQPVDQYVTFGVVTQGRPRMQIGFSDGTIALRPARLLPAPPRRRRTLDDWKDKCMGCGDGGSLLLCFSCCQSSHVSCAPGLQTAMQRGFKEVEEWVCADCAAHVWEQTQ